MSNKASCAIIGYPRIGRGRELKQALESYWVGKSDATALAGCATALRAKHWLAQAESGLDWVCVNDFSYYDGMLDTCILLGMVPERFQALVGLDRYFAMARGNDRAPAMRMRKWFNTNYHYIVPELPSSSSEALVAPDFSKLEGELSECLASGYRPKVSLIGPLTFLRLAEGSSDADPLKFLSVIMDTYCRAIAMIARMAPDALIQMDEPILAVDPDVEILAAFESVYRGLCVSYPHANLMIATYFEHVAEALPIIARLPLKGVALDFVHGIDNLTALEKLEGWECGKLFAGVVNGRNIWANDRAASLTLLGRIREAMKGKGEIVISSSCSLLHTPYSAADETSLPESLKRRLSFAQEKLTELRGLADAFAAGERLAQSAGTTAQAKHAQSSAEEADAAKPGVPRRQPAAGERAKLQKERLNLPLLPTTTIGSFPQTKELRELRASVKRGAIDQKTYRAGLERLTSDCVRIQEELGLDVLVHGEFERNDMVEYFGENLDGFAFTKNGWVQSYGSRCVKPPIIFGDVSRPRPITVDTIRFAQTQTKKPLKGMLTGPVTIMTWSFVREDIPRAEVCMQIARALGQEILDLEAAGLAIIQVDEAAFKEAYPLRKTKRAAFEAYAIDAFRLATGGVRPDTQIHSHMCYSDFSDIMEAIEALDADVLSIEAARGGEDVLEFFVHSGYARAVGPGVYDIHSPRVPSREEFEAAIRKRVQAIGAERLWINPDCGLKTRSWQEAGPALRRMVEAAITVRAELARQNERA
jgi:5-methyltetrahydropteroyltriglutamate--homocysteine methyltransferase